MRSLQLLNLSHRKPLALPFRRYSDPCSTSSNMKCEPESKPTHLICFKYWTPEMLLEVLNSAIALKAMSCNTPGLKWDTLSGAKVAILQEVNKPLLNVAVSIASTMLGASDVCVVDEVMWDHDYNGRVFSLLSDVIFVSTAKHGCVERFAKHSKVPVLCMHSRAHSTIQSLSTVMAIIEEFGTMKDVRIGYLGPAHQTLNSYLLLSPMLGAHIQYKCCSEKTPVSPLLFKTGEDMSEKWSTKFKVCKKREEVFDGISVLIAGPTTKKPEFIKEFTISMGDLKNADKNWIFFHTCPKGKEIGDDIFYHSQARTYNAFENFKYIAASLMAYVVQGFRFS